MRVDPKKYFVFGFLLILLHPITAFSQNISFSFPIDSTEVHTRTVDDETLQSITDEQVFEYNELAQNPETLMSRIQRWLVQVIQYIMNNRWASVFIKFIFFGIFAMVLVALINQLLGGNLNSSFSKKKARDPLAMKIGESELSETNYDELLSNALSENRYHDAVRILYLKALQQLNKSELIHWKPDKTNHDYLRELGNHPLTLSFSRLTSFYEYVEYGDFQIEKEGFQSVQNIYHEFQKVSEHP